MKRARWRETIITAVRPLSLCLKFSEKTGQTIFSFQKPCHPWQFNKLFSRKAKTNGKELLPLVLPEVGPRTTSTVGLSDMVTRGSQASK